MRQTNFLLPMSFKEHLQSTSGKPEHASWLEKKRLHIEQQWYLINNAYVERVQWC
jgi:hypothetical protein